MKNNMIDIHTHIIPGIDDGCRSVDESIKTLEKLKELGFSKVILTPHYIDNSSYCVNNSIKKGKLDILKNKLKEKEIALELYLGNEIYINSDIDKLISEDNVHSLNNTKYLLIEFPLSNEINNIEDYLHELKVKGYIPVIAHPERYTYFQDDYKKVDRLCDEGVLFQSNYASIMNKYGKKAGKLLKYMLKNNMISFLATDVHHPNSSLLDDFDKCLKKIEKITGKDKLKELTEINPLKLLNNEEIRKN